MWGKSQSRKIANLPTFRSRPSRGKGLTQSFPAPVMGWNARDSYASMDIHFASTMQNWWPQPTYVELRSGFTKTATGLPSNINSLMGYYPSSGTKKLFGAAGSGIYDCTSSGAVSSAVVSGLTSDKWQHTLFSNAAGDHLICVNGNDNGQIYDGSTWSDLSVTGVASSSLVSVNSHKTRLWFTEINTLKAWYLATEAISGALTEYDLSSVFSKGGKLLQMVTWTLDGGSGMDDYAAFITDAGQIAIYQGTDPASSSTWSLIGVYNIGKPIGYRCAAKYGGDVLIICMNGVLPMSKLMQSTRVSMDSFVSYNIQQAISSATSLYNGNFGWQTALFPQANLLVLNVPVDSSTNQQQYCMNTLHGAWTNFTGWPANCFEVWDGNLYFGGTNYVAQAWSGYQDDTSDILADCIQAYSYFGADTALKRWTMARPIFNTSGNPQIGLRVNVDFDLQEPTTNLSFTPTVYGTWDTSKWDGAIWGGSQNIQKDWQGISGSGYAGAAHLAAVSDASLQWLSTDFVYELGAVV